MDPDTPERGTNLVFPFIHDVLEFPKICKIGQGTFGEVFKAKNLANDSFVALKKILMENEKEGFPITAIREIKILQLLRHENIVNLLEVCRSNEDVYKGCCASFYLVFEFCEHDLAGLLSNKNVNFSLAENKKIMQMLFNALFFLHYSRILHRDIKTSNILMTKRGVLKLADFGLARALNHSEKDESKNRYTNRVVTLWYRAPELLLGERNYDYAIDLWATGCIMVELWTRSPILQGSSETDQLKLISSLCGSITADVWPGVDKRYPSLSQMDLGNPVKCRVIERLRPYVKNEPALALIQKLLCLDPKQRIDANNALNHDFFWCDPLPTELESTLSKLTSSNFEIHAASNRQQQAGQIQNHSSQIKKSSETASRPNQQRFMNASSSNTNPLNSFKQQYDRIY